MWHDLLIIAGVLLVPSSLIGLVIAVETRGINKELAAEDNEQLVPLRIHGRTLMLTPAEYEAHLEDTADPRDDRFSKF